MIFSREIFKNNIALFVLSLLFMAQIAVCAYQIVKYESILIFGKKIVLPTTSYDPYDAFRGRYVAISIPSQSFITNKRLCEKQCRGTFFVTYKDGLNASGLSEIDDVFLGKPKTDLAYLKVDGDFYPKHKNMGELSFAYSFDRYYMREDLAIAADRDRRLLSANNNARIVVRTLNAKGLIEDVIVGDQNRSLNEYLMDFTENREKEN